ncbi:MAG: 4Fe-4S binding protein [Calditrichaceae bacterium]|nr:4Fe-4S binding protein [Calditrichia bacterium]NUQ41773.1 4Fe-4S binding protein [Calditrichaceae bacterium]
MKRRPWLFFWKPSTRSFIQEARKTSHYSLFDWIHGYIYARWPYFYIGVGVGEHPLKRFFLPLWNLFSRVFEPRREDAGKNGKSAFAEGYHGKVIPLEEASRLVAVNREVSLKDLEQVIPYSRARDIILRNPGHIVALECPCRASRPSPCKPLDVCLIIGEPFASFIIEHHPRRSRWITQGEAAEILRAEHERGHVHHAFFKDAMLGRFYAICNCCACCCGAMQAWRNGTPMLASSGYVSRIDPERCVGCETCIEYCQFGALKMEEGVAMVDEGRCMGCGVCVSKCAHEAHSLVRDPARGEPLQIRELLNSAAREARIAETI